MKFTIKRKVKINLDLKTLHIRAGVRYWEDATVNGIEDTEGSLIPCKLNDDWIPIIELETGKILNWNIGNTADIHYKVCDDGAYYLFGEDEEKHLLKKEGYVPDCLSVNDNGYGDYIIIQVNGNGFIKDWVFTKEHLKEFKYNK